ncbi:MAG: hypothetical protein AABZ15_02845 [Nitrospirota bacterium]
MIAKTVTKANLKDLSEIRQNLEFWLSKSPEDRIAAVERLRRERHGSSERLQRTARVVQLKDLADVEAIEGG